MNSQQSPTSSRGPRSNSRTLLIRWFGTLLTLALLIYLFTRVGWSDIYQALKQIDLWRFILCIFLMLLSRMAVAARWYTLLHSADIKIRLVQTIKITYAGLFASNFLPTTIGGDVVRLGGIIQLGFDKAVCLASLIVDRLVGMAGMASALLLGIPVFLQYIREPGKERSINHTAHLAFSMPVSSRLSRLLMKVRNALQRLLSAVLLWREHPGSLTAAFAFTWMHQVSLYFQMWLLLTGMGDSLSLWSIAGLWSATYFVTLLPVSINGMGMQELSATFFFTSIGGITLEHSLTLAILIRALQALASLPGAAFIPRMLSGEARLD